jgi:hypothetical protein
MDWGSPDGPIGPGIGFLAVVMIFLVIKNVIGGRIDRWALKQDQRRAEESRKQHDEYWTEFYRKQGKIPPQDTKKPEA